MTQQERYEYKKKWAEDNAEKVRESKRKYYENNKQKVVEAARAWELENKDRVKELRAAARQKKRASLGVKEVYKHAKCRSCGVPYTEELTYNNNTFSRCMPCKRASNQARRLNDPFPKENYRILLEAFGTWCPYCETDGHKLTTDHITPISKGGDNSIENLLPCCLSCNISKNATPIHIWKPELSHLSLPGDYERE